VRSLVSNSIYAKKGRNGPPSASQVASKPFLLTQNLSPKDIARSDIMKLKVS